MVRNDVEKYEDLQTAKFHLFQESWFLRISRILKMIFEVLFLSDFGFRGISKQEDSKSMVDIDYVLPFQEVSNGI